MEGTEAVNPTRYQPCKGLAGAQDWALDPVCHPECSGEAVLGSCSCCHPGEGVGGTEPTMDPCDATFPCAGMGSPSQPSPGCSVTYVDLSSVEPILVDDPGNEAEASEPSKCPWMSRVG